MFTAPKPASPLAAVLCIAACLAATVPRRLDTPSPCSHMAGPSLDFCVAFLGAGMRHHARELAAAESRCTDAASVPVPAADVEWRADPNMSAWYAATDVTYRVLEDLERHMAGRELGTTYSRTCTLPSSRGRWDVQYLGPLSFRSNRDDEGVVSLFYKDSSRSGVRLDGRDRLVGTALRAVDRNLRPVSSPPIHIHHIHLHLSRRQVAFGIGATEVLSESHGDGTCPGLHPEWCRVQVLPRGYELDLAATTYALDAAFDRRRPWDREFWLQVAVLTADPSSGPAPRKPHLALPSTLRPSPAFAGAAATRVPFHGDARATFMEWKTFELPAAYQILWMKWHTHWTLLQDAWVLRGDLGLGTTPPSPVRTADVGAEQARLLARGRLVARKGGAELEETPDGDVREVYGTGTWTQECMPRATNLTVVAFFRWHPRAPPHPPLAGLSHVQAFTLLLPCRSDGAYDPESAEHVVPGLF